ANSLGPGADEDQAGIGASLREIRVLGEESIAGMNRFSAALAGGHDDGIDIEIAFLGSRGADRRRRIGELHMQRIAVGVGVDRDCAKAHALCRADDPASDLATVGDQQRAEAPEERHPYILNMPNRVGSGAGALSPAAMASPSTVRVSAGSMMPSSQMRAVA